MDIKDIDWGDPTDDRPKYIGHCLYCDRDDRIGPDRLGIYVVCYDCLAKEQEDERTDSAG